VSSWPYSAWYAGGWDAEIDRQPLAAMICGAPVLRHRKLDRQVVAMRDACPHPAEEARA
jgi:phenylpropionate dioxygenase-like ring-hydroxylating dioxygenase large terminal subunit